MMIDFDHEEIVYLLDVLDAHRDEFGHTQRQSLSLGEAADIHDHIKSKLIEAARK